MVRAWAIWSLLWIGGAVVFYCHWMWQAGGGHPLTFVIGFIGAVAYSFTAGLYLWFIGCGVYCWIRDVTSS